MKYIIEIHFKSFLHCEMKYENVGINPFPLAGKLVIRFQFNANYVSEFTPNFKMMVNIVAIYIIIIVYNASFFLLKGAKWF